MPARKVTKKTAKKGGTLDADLTSIAVPFGLLLAKQSLEKLSGKKVKATKGKTVKRMKRVAVGGNANAANAVVNTGNAVVNTVNTTNSGNVSGANVGGKSVKKGRGRPRSRVGGNANAVNATNAVVNATNSGNVSGVNTMAPKTGANVGGKSVKKGRGRPRSRVGGNANAVNAVVNTVNTTNSGNVSGVNTMAPKTGANVGGKGKKNHKI